MSRFVSRYGAVLSFRKSLREEKRADYLKAKALVDDCFDEIQSKNDSIDDTRGRNELIVSSNSQSSRELAQNSQFIRNQYLVIQQLRDKSRILIQESDRLYQIFVEQQKELKIVEKLMEKEEVKFKLEMNKKEMNAIADMQIIRSKRKAS